MKCSAIRVPGASSPQPGHEEMFVPEFVAIIGASGTVTLSGMAGNLTRGLDLDRALTVRVFVDFTDALCLVAVGKGLRGPRVVLDEIFLLPRLRTMTRPEAVPAKTPTRNCRIVSSKCLALLVQCHVHVGFLGAIVTEDLSPRCSPDVIHVEDFSPAGGTDNHTLAHSP